MEINKFRYSINYLRGLSVLAVVAFHAQSKLIPFGYLGVDVFFLISGFLMTRIIWEEIRNHKFSFVAFYQRRIRRILPAMTVMALSSSFIAFLTLMPYEMKIYSQSLVATILFVPNVYFQRSAGYFSPESQDMPLIHMWSLGIEEQFYIFLPLLLFFLLKRSMRVVVFTITVLIGLSFALSQISHLESNFSFYSLVTRAWEFLFGSLIGLMSLQFPQYVKCKKLILKTSYSLLVVTLFTPFFTFVSLNIATCVLLICATIIILSEHSVGADTINNLPLRTLNLIGLMSFSLYLWHQPILVFIRAWNLAPISLLVSLGAIVASFVISFISWKLIETPFRRPGHFSNVQVNIFICVLAISALIFGLIGHATNGYPQRNRIGNLDTGFITLARGSDIPAIGIDGSICTSETPSYCKIQNSDSSVNVLLVGDSHSADYDRAFRNYAANFNVNAWQFSTPGCNFLPSKALRHDGDCRKSRILLERLLHEKNFSRIFFIQDLNEHELGLPKKNLLLDINSFESLMNLMLNSSKEVIYFLPRETLNVDPIKAARIGQLIKVKTKVTPEISRKFLQEFDHRKNLRLFNESDRLVDFGCGSLSCFNGIARDGKPLYRDSNHLTAYAADLIFTSVNNYFP